MQINHIEYFLEVARCQSISKAAKNLFITQSTLSTSIATFENELGFKLFTRLRQGVILTPEGEKVLEDAQKILTTISNWKELSHSTSTLAGTVHIISQPAITNYALVDVLTACYKQYPSINVNIRDTQNKTFFDSLINNKSTIGLAFYTPDDYEFIYEQARLYKFNTEILYFDELLVYFNKSSALAHLKEITLKDLLEYNLVSYPHQNNQAYSGIQSHFFKNKVFTLPKAGDQLELISQNSRIIGLFTSLLRKELDKRFDLLISTAPIKNYPTPLVIVMFYPEYKSITAAEQIVLDLIRNQFKIHSI